MHPYGFDGVTQIDGIFVSLVSKPAVTYFLPAGKLTTMQFSNGIIEAIGNTPLIKLKRVSEATGCTILGKAEFMNPGQSVKDRAALFIIEDAVKKGELRPGGVIVEGTAGNTGIGLALVGNAMGFRTVIVIPETQSQEKKDTLAAVRRGIDRSTRGPLFQSQQLRETLRPPRRAIGEDRTSRRDLGEPVRQCRQSPGPHRHDGTGNLAPDRRQGRRLLSARSVPAARSPASP